MTEIKYVNCELDILDDEHTRYRDDYRADTPVDGRIRDDQAGDSLVQDTIERLHDWVADDDRNITREDLELLGRHLYYFLFDEAIRKGFEQSYRAFRNSADPSRRLRLRLAFHQESMKLASYPWEFLFMPKRENQPGFFLCAEKRTELILTRVVPESIEDRLQPESDSLKVLAVFSNPRELGGRLDGEKFLGQITSTRRMEVKAITAEDGPGALTKDGVGAAIKDFGPQIFHFIGHGDAERGIALLKTPEEIQEHYDATGEMKDVEWVDARALSALFTEPQLADPPPRLVFLHACEGATASSMRGFDSMARDLVYLYEIPAVVAMQYVISNEAAALFAKTFYKHISEGARIDIAVSEGRWALRQSRRGEFADRGFGTPIVYLQDDNAIVLHELEEEEGPPKAAKCPYSDFGCPGWVVPGNPSCPTCTRPLKVCVKGHAMRADAGKCPEGDPALDAGAAQGAAASSSHLSQRETGRSASAPELAQALAEPSTDRKTQFGEALTSDESRER
jgi:hypothetical protein